MVKSNYTLGDILKIQLTCHTLQQFEIISHGESVTYIDGSRAILSCKS